MVWNVTNNTNNPRVSVWPVVRAWQLVCSGYWRHGNTESPQVREIVTSHVTWASCDVHKFRDIKIMELIKIRNKNPETKFI